MHLFLNLILLFLIMLLQFMCIYVHVRWTEVLKPPSASVIVRCEHRDIDIENKTPVEYFHLSMAQICLQCNVSISFGITS